jgi:ribonuclease D
LLAAAAPRVAVDLEASGMHSYRARLCTIQMAWDAGETVVVVDALATPIEPLSPFLACGTATKIVHDVGFDARLLAESGIVIDNVRDTSIEARMLGRTSVGLAALLESELHVRISKAMQQRDWRERPLDPDMMGYLSEDVRHLEALERALWSQVVGLGIEEAVIEETRYRIECAVANVRARPSSPGYLRLKGADRLAERELAALRAIFDLRERAAAAMDVPPYSVVTHTAMLALARARPTTADAVAQILGALARLLPHGFLQEVADALASAGERIPEDEHLLAHPPRPSGDAVRARRSRETRLLSWRRAEARTRGVDEQVILPGHCLKDAVDDDVRSVEGLARVAGIGAFRVQRDGEAIVRALRGGGETG